MRIAVAMGALLRALPAQAVQPGEQLANPALEQRARDLSAGLRCLVCQNQSIDDSDAPLAKDLRLLVRERLSAGDSDSDVQDFIVARYGEFVLLNPPFGWKTFILWLAPFGLLLGGGFLLARRGLARRQPLPTQQLSEAERARLDELLDNGTAPPPR